MMRRVSLSITFILLFNGLFLLQVHAQETSAPQYIVTVSEQDKRLAKIEVRFSPKTDTILMSQDGANHLPDGWATYIRSLTAKTDAGVVIPLQYLGQAKWKIPQPLPQNLNLSYEVLIHHDQGVWPFGYDEAAYAKRDCVFYTGAALFISAFEFKNIGVQFNIPSGWHVSTPWREVAGKTNSFFVSNMDELINIGMLVGKHTERIIKFSNLNVTLAIGQELEESANLFESSIKPILPEAIKLFGGTPVINGTQAGKFIVIVNKDVYDGGGTFIRSVSMLFKNLPTARNKDVWQHVIAHEILHLWNGQTIREAEQENWLLEGFTDYLAYTLEARTRLISQEDFFKAVALKYDEYLAVAGKKGMRPAGEEKEKNYDLVYSGGFIAAFALDIELRKNTNGTKGLGDFMRQMYQEFGISGRQYKFEDVKRISSAIAKTDLSDFFNEYIEGAKVISLDSYLDYLGLRIEKENIGNKRQSIIRKKSKVSLSQQKNLSSMIRNAHALN